MNPSNTAVKASFHFIRYGSVWEDADILCEALTPVGPGGNLLSIASAGDNAMALLTLDPKQVVAVDLSAPQLACLELRMAAFNRLDLEQVWAFLGVISSSHRLATYKKLRADLSQNAKKLWDNLPRAIENGIIHSGKFERYLRTFGQFILPLIHGKNVRDSLFQPRTQIGRLEFYNEHWNTWCWRGIFQLFFSRVLMGSLGRDPSFFDYVEGNIASRILKRTEHALTHLCPWHNPYLHYIVTGNYSEQALPKFLRPEHFDKIRSNLGRIRLAQTSVENSGYGPFNGFNLSDLFEYLDLATFQKTYQSLIDQAQPGARLAYWNMMVPRRCPSYLHTQVISHDTLAQKLHQQDKAWFYQKFILEEVASCKK